jgi:hypothetical protein
MTAKLIVPIAMACLLMQFTGCKKKDDTNLLVNQHSITFGYSDNTKTVTISNVGSTDFTWTVNSPSDLLEFSKTSGSCSKNQPDTFIITLLRQKVHADSTSATVTITASTGETSSISLLILGFPEKKIRYTSQIYNAAYDLVHDRLILLSYANGARFFDILDMGTNSFSQIPLDGSGDFLSVSPDGSYAITSSDNNSRIIYADLIQKKVINTFSVEQFNNGLVACADKQCYFFPYYNNNDIGKINLNTGIFSSYNFTTYLDLDMAVLHPSGNYIYTAGSYMLSKFNISAQEPVLVYTNTSYNTESKLWFSKEGTRLFTAGKKVLTLNPVLPANDITGTTDVPISQYYIYSLDHNMAHSEFYIIPTNSSYNADYQSDQLLVLNDDLTQQRTIMLEDFYFQNPYSQPGYTTSDALGEYVFSTSDGGKIIVISEASNSYYNAWGIEIIDRTWK